MKEGHLKKNLIEILTLALLIFATYYLIMKDKDFDEVLEVLIGSSKIWLIAALIVITVYVFCGGYCIKVIQKGLGRFVSIWQCFKYSFIEIYFSAITPSSTGGQPMQLYYMSKDGFPVSESTVILLAITALYKGAFVVISLLLFIFNMGFIGEKIAKIWPLALLGFVCSVIFVVFLYLVIFSKKLINVIVVKSVSLLSKLQLIKNKEEKLESINQKLAEYHECAKFFKEHKKVMFKAAVVLAVQKLALVSIPCLVYASFGLKEYAFYEILATQCLLNISVELLPIPGAVGISETVFFMLFTPIFTESRITTAVLLSRGISFYIPAIVAGLVVCGTKISDIIKENTTKGNSKQ